MYALFASTASGLEERLKQELEIHGILVTKMVSGGVYFQANKKQLYLSLLWSRLASRILLPLKFGKLNDAKDLYALARDINWCEIFDNIYSFSIHFTGTNAHIRHNHFGAQLIKDAVVDTFAAQNFSRPCVNLLQPDIHIRATLHHEEVYISLDLSGGSLHQRGYRQLAGEAPLKENLAAALVLRSDWQPGTPLIDPFCGSGTLLIEGAMIAADHAPGLYRQSWGFNAWKEHDSDCWKNVFVQAQKRSEEGRKKLAPVFFGYDKDPNIIAIARQNIARASFDEAIQVACQEALSLTNPFPAERKGMLLSNPPYGERLESKSTLIALYTGLGTRIKQEFAGWQLSLISTAPELLDNLRLRAHRQTKAKNGQLEIFQKNYAISKTIISQTTPLAAQDFVSRLQKNLKSRQRWAAQENTDCYRLYDADLPDYNLAIDRYGDWAVLQEYAAPKTIDPGKARQRLGNAITATLQVLNISGDRLIVKTRERQRGENQYQKLDQKNHIIQVNEYQAQFWVNLTDYLDTGLFLDHRRVRRLIGEMCKGKDFLNLFAYTGTASVHAGLGRARTTTTVDMSRTYLAWAERNLRLNHLTGRQHRLIQADCLTWITQCDEKFDVIFVDPPTFSNSKRMQTEFDVQRDHVRLLAALKLLLRDNGSLIFSSNKKGFELEKAALSAQGLAARDITVKTQSRDFDRPHHGRGCWLMTHTK